MTIPQAVDVAVPVPVPQPFTYSVPDHLREIVVPGSAVVVSFGTKVLTGVVLRNATGNLSRSLKPIIDVADTAPLVSAADLLLAQWISEYYLAPIGEAMRLFLPPGLSQMSKRIVRRTDRESDPSLYTPLQQTILAVLSDGPHTVQQLQKMCRTSSVHTAVSELATRGCIVVEEQVGKRVAEKKEWFLQRMDADDRESPKGARQKKLWDVLRAERNDEIAVIPFLKRNGGTMSTLRSLEERGYIRLTQKEVSRIAAFVPDAQTERQLGIQLNEQQRVCVDAITSAVMKRSADQFLLHGITGSGKTQVYIEAIRTTLEAGRTAVVLIPEISLTPQTVRRFQTHFRGDVVWMHSRMSDGERQDAWRAAHRGTCRIVIGPRSALFAPLKDLGLIIVDEEHEASYKQFDASPRYHARDAAIMRGHFHNATVVLGSATPSLESYTNARSGRSTLLTLPERADAAVLPPVEIVNMVEERSVAYAAAKVRAKEVGKVAFTGLARSISRKLEEKIRDRLEKREGTILLQNRRGFAPFTECNSCGHIERCEQCNVTMTYHATKKHLRCHYCGTVRPAPTECPECGGFEFTLQGFGTQRVEQELAALFPAAKILRMDMDTTTRKGSHERILEQFGSGGADILLGTQMVAKGLDFPRVTLVGVISADTQMMLPDFRSAERTFQLLTQVAGRAGRSTLAGEVVIQTSQPHHYALRFAQQHDYTGFYEEELGFRQALLYPPYSRVIAVEFRGKDERSVEKTARQFGERLSGSIAREAILGPSPAVLSKLKNEYRWQILLKADREKDKNGTRARHAVARVLKDLSDPSSKSGVRISVDVDPSGTL